MVKIIIENYQAGEADPGKLEEHMKHQTLFVRAAFVMSILLITPAASATEFHVSARGSDTNDGSLQRPFKTISAAARVAQPGDVITVHEGVYRERISPPRGGESDDKRIVYQAAPGEKVEIKGSEVDQRVGEGAGRCLEGDSPQFVLRRLQSVQRHDSRRLVRPAGEGTSHRCRLSQRRLAE